MDLVHSITLMERFVTLVISKTAEYVVMQLHLVLKEVLCSMVCLHKID